MIDQTTLGHTFLKEEFDFTPSVGWQIDPFGHSSTQASLLSAEAGFDALYFGRIDYQDLQLRRDSQRVEGIWRASANSKDQSQVFWGLSGSYGGNYGPPSGFCFDNFCSDEPMMDDPDLEDYNVDVKVSDFVAAAWDQANQARGTHIMMTMGSDFQYENSEVWFRNLDSVIKNVNQYAEDGKIEADPNGRFGGIKLVYSNPDIYTLAKNKDELDWEVKTDDFFPYSDCENCFWTGYFTSRAELKKWERTGSAFLQAARQFETLDSVTPAKDVKSTFDSPIHKLDAAVGVVQHHDGVSGTAKQHVAFDYAKRIDVGFKTAADYVTKVLDNILKAKHPDATPPEFSICQGLNVSTCEATQSVGFEDGEKLVVGVYNSLSHARTEIVGVPVQSGGEYVVYDGTEQVEIEASVIANSFPMDESAAPYTLYFQAEDLHPMGMKFYSIKMGEAKAEPVPAAASTATSRRSLRGKEDNLKVSTSKFTVEFSPSGQLLSIGDQKVSQSWGYYTSFDSTRNELGVTPQPQGDYAWTPGVPGTCLPGYLDAEGDEEVRGTEAFEGQGGGMTRLK
jgi:alpha-mannosidase